MIGFRMEFQYLFDFAMVLSVLFVRTFNVLAKRVEGCGGIAVENTRKAAKGMTETLFSKMVPEDGRSPMADDQTTRKAINVIIAGTDTTAMALTYLTFEVLGMKLSIRNGSPVTAGPEHSDWRQLEEMNYLNQVIQET